MVQHVVAEQAIGSIQSPVQSFRITKVPVHDLQRNNPDMCVCVIGKVIPETNSDTNENEVLCSWHLETREAVHS